MNQRLYIIIIINYIISAVLLAQDTACFIENQNLIEEDSRGDLVRETMAKRIGDVDEYDLIVLNLGWLVAFKKEKNKLVGVKTAISVNDGIKETKIGSKEFLKIISKARDLTDNAKRNVEFSDAESNLSHFYIYVKDAKSNLWFNSGYVGSPIEKTKCYEFSEMLLIILHGVDPMHFHKELRKAKGRKKQK